MATGLARPPQHLFDVVHDVIEHHHDEDRNRSEHPLTLPLGKSNQAERTLDPEANGRHGFPDESSEAGQTEVTQEAFCRAESPDQDDEPPSPLISREQAKHRPRRSSVSGIRLPPPDTPSGRTGPPRSISRSYSLSQTPGFDTSMHRKESLGPRWSDDQEGDEGPDRNSDFRITNPFRDVMEYQEPHQRERERHRAEKMARRRDSMGGGHDLWSSVKKRLDTPREEAPHFRWIVDSGEEGKEKYVDEKGKGKEKYVDEKGKGKEKYVDETGKGKEKDRADGDVPGVTEEQKMGSPSADTEPSRPPGSPPRLAPPHSQSMPHIQRSQSERQHPNVAPKWNRLRSLLPQIAAQHKTQPPQASTVVPQSVNITDELIAGGLSALVLRLWFERDEREHRRVPILFHRLRIRVSDSLHPLHGNKAVFRIECEYANGAVRWVVYRQLREFLSLHAHYTVSNAYFRNVETLPDFPMMSLPYFKFLKERNKDVGRADFARMQREALENYLIGLVRAVMWHPSANRLAGFLEISALMVSLAQSGGAQYKAGMLRIESVGNKGILGRRATSWRERKAPKWCSVRESYLVVHEEIGELAVWDVFLIDTEFRIERPTRYLRQGLSLLQHFEDDHPEEVQPGQGSAMVEAYDSHQPSHTRHRVSSIKSHLSKVFHFGRHDDPERSKSTANVHETYANGGHGDTRASTDPGHHRLSASSAASSSSSSPSRPVTPMLDPSTNTNPLLGAEDHDEYKPDENGNPNSKKRKSRLNANEVSKHTFYVENSQMRLKLYAKNERQMLQWIAALERVARDCHYTGKNRFDSFAPIRLNVAAQWLVDGRDYFWNLSRAMMLATESIYIHDWWLSPELQLRRPGMPKYRLDNLLERKAKEGVKIYIIVYQEVSSRTTPTDSNYTKQRLTALHPNIMVQRSPSHFQTGTFYWAHHEKLCVIDQAIAFMGGLDLCFGRWDTPQHVIIDDPEGVPEGAECIWPGKDYSNPRISDFHTLSKPHEDMYDRSKVPRMPWHDVGMQVVGQPARDLARHFVQRWNHLLRIKNHTRLMPMLLPPPEFRPGELTQMGLTGTCEFQITRSAGPWSLGTPDRIEHSIQNAYLKAIQMSEHFVYIENQFFITSTVVNEVTVENRIGDALVARIIRAHRERTPWKCCVVIPLVPGFTYPIDHSDASSIRIIMECQNRTICRGPNSIFGRLRKEGIDPDDYIAFLSLRNWGKLRDGVLTTEEVYIHGKVCIVDDRLAIIGSANINERSQRGDRDSELAAVIRDTDMLECTMGGKPFKVGRFAHTLRVRLMREHIGVDVDGLHEDDLMASESAKAPDQQSQWDPEVEEERGKETGVTHIGKGQERTAMSNLFHDGVDGAEQAIHGTSEAGDKDLALLLRMTGIKSKGLDLTADERFLHEERQMYNREGQKVSGFPSSVVPTLEEKIVAENLPPASQAVGHPLESDLQNDAGGPNQTEEARMPDGELFGAPANAAPNSHMDSEPPHARGAVNDATEEENELPRVRSLLRKHANAKMGQKAWALPTPTPRVDPDGFEDPVCDEFWKNVWLACAVHNTEIFRKVFHAVPDDLVTTWKQYREFILHHERLNQPVRQSSSREPLGRVPSELGDRDAPGQPHTSENTVHSADYAQIASSGHNTSKEYINGDAQQPSSSPSTPPATGQDEKARGRKNSRAAEPLDETEREEMERMLQELRGHLVLYPTRFLEGEDAANNFLFNADRLMPLPIYD